MLMASQHTISCSEYSVLGIVYEQQKKRKYCGTNKLCLLCDARDCAMTGNCLLMFSHSVAVQGSDAVSNTFSCQPQQNPSNLTTAANSCSDPCDIRYETSVNNQYNIYICVNKINQILRNRYCQQLEILITLIKLH